MTKFTDYLYDILQNSIEAKAEHIKLSLKRNGLLRVLIEDDGIGMDKDTLLKVRTFSYSSRRKRNVGLGLSLIHDLSTSTNGYFNIDSTLGVGTTLSIGFDDKHIDFPEFGSLEALLGDLYIHQGVKNFTLMYEDVLLDFKALGFDDESKTMSQKKKLEQVAKALLTRGGYENN
ncbi:MAG: ATP-binding protein [Acholeplasma sp.]|nr:ATP-binding protein [Acholeplasma sp.]